MINCSPLGESQTGYMNGAALAAGNVLRTIDEMDNLYSIDMETQRSDLTEGNPNGLFNCVEGCAVQPLIRIKN